jgi:hypothetical protein
LSNELLDLGDKGFHTPESSAANCPLGDNVERYKPGTLVTYLLNT